MRRLAGRFPVHYHLMNSPDRPRSVGRVFIEQLANKRRIRYVAERAPPAGDVGGFHLGYHVFFPECERRRDTPNATLFSYNATRDRAMMATIASRLDRFGAAPPPAG